MVLLSLESSTALGGVALFKNGEFVAEKFSLRQRSHSEFLNLATDELLRSHDLTLTDIDLFAVTNGPGSFTGIRVAGNIAKSFAFATGKKLWIVDSLSVLASQITWAGPTLIGLNAFKNMIYASFYKGQTKIEGPIVVPIESLSQKLSTYFQDSTVNYLGDCFSNFDPNLRIAEKPELSSYPTAKQLGELFHKAPKMGQTLDWNSFVPLYLRGSEAEENLRLRASEKS